MPSNLFTTLLHLSLVTLTMAAPMSALKESTPMGYNVGGGVGGFIVLVLDIIVWSESILCFRPAVLRNASPGNIN